MDPRYKDLWLKGNVDEQDIRKAIHRELESRFRLMKGTCEQPQFEMSR